MPGPVGPRQFDRVRRVRVYPEDHFCHLHLTYRGDRHHMVPCVEAVVDASDAGDDRTQLEVVGLLAPHGNSGALEGVLIGHQAVQSHDAGPGLGAPSGRPRPGRHGQACCAVRRSDDAVVAERGRWSVAPATASKIRAPVASCQQMVRMRARLDGSAAITGSTIAT
jgi:hypothetical protein